MGLINLQVIDNTNDTTTFHSQLSTQRLRKVEIRIVPLSFEVNCDQLCEKPPCSHANIDLFLQFQNAITFT